PSHLHRLLHDELWYFHDGSSIVVHCFYPDGTYEAVRLGRDIEHGEQLQFRVPAGTIFGSEVLDDSSFGLVSCAVAPGFDYHDFELFTQDQLLAKYPEQAEVIKRVAYQKLPTE
ncbi:MAG: cupin domain-containing protein, partial [Lactobacillus sp.]|nr:cupin domain-containing protein [Lactobacillus sp.]